MEEASGRSFELLQETNLSKANAIFRPLCFSRHVSGTAILNTRGRGAWRRKPPLIHFNLDFGSAFGGSYSAKAIRLWLDPFLRTTLASMVVWPNRIVVPILPESVTGSLDHLYLRYRLYLTYLPCVCDDACLARLCREFNMTKEVKRIPETKRLITARSSRNRSREEKWARS